MKNKIKKFLPKPLVEMIRKNKMKYNLRKLYRHDFLRFKKSFSSDESSANFDQLRARLMFYAHSIEKGLSHENFRAKFGQKALRDLSRYMNIYSEKKYDKSDIRYQIALSALKNYTTFHAEKGIDVEEILSDIFSEEILFDLNQALIGIAGFLSVSELSKSTNKEKSFEELSRERVSVRSFSKEKIDFSKIEKAIEISMKSPSVCNRQPSRVIVIKNKDIISQVLKIQGGFSGYDIPPVLLLVTANNTSFVSIYERNEGFIDGGLFSMSLLYALEFESVAACALNAMLSIEQENDIREILSISREETLIMFIAVGNFDVNSKVPVSYRDSYVSIMRVID